MTRILPLSVTVCVVFQLIIGEYTNADSTCAKPIELTLLVDTSSNLEPGPKGDVTWVAMTAFMMRVLDALNVASNRSGAFVVTYSDDVTELFHFNNLRDKSQVIENLQATPNFSGSADVIKAIEHVTSYVKADDKADTDDVISVLLVLSNEKSMNYSKDIRKGELRHPETMFVIGASSDADKNFLEWLSVAPHERKKQWWPLPNYDFLSFFTDVYLPSVCKEKETTTAPTTEAPRCPLGRFGVDCAGFCHCQGGVPCDLETGNCPEDTECEYDWSGFPECQKYIGLPDGEGQMKARPGKTYSMVVVVVPCVIAVALLTVIIIILVLFQRRPKDKVVQKVHKWDPTAENDDTGPRYVNVVTLQANDTKVPSDGTGSHNDSPTSFRNNMFEQPQQQSIETISCGSPGTLKRNKHSPLPPVPTFQRGRMTQSNLSLYKFRHDSTSTVETDLSAPNPVSSLTSLSASGLLASSPNVNIQREWFGVEALSSLVQARRYNGLIVVKGQRSIPSRLQPRLPLTSAEGDSETEYVEIRDTMHKINDYQSGPNIALPNPIPRTPMGSNLDLHVSPNLPPNTDIYPSNPNNQSPIYDETPRLYSSTDDDDDVFDKAMIYNGSTTSANTSLTQDYDHHNHNNPVPSILHGQFNPYFSELTGPYEVDFDTLDTRRFSINSLPNYPERIWN